MLQNVQSKFVFRSTDFQSRLRNSGLTMDFTGLCVTKWTLPLKIYL